MLKSFCTEKEIKDRLSEIGKMHPQLYNLLLEKVEFDKYLRFKKTIRQSVRRIIAMGIRGYVRELFSKDVVSKINSPSKKKKILFVAGLTANIVGMSIYLRKEGKFETILLIENPWLVRFFEQYFDRVYVYNSYYEVANILLSIRPYIMHVHGSSHYYFLGVLAKCLNNTGVIIGFVDPPSFEPGTNNSEELRKKPKDTQLDCFSEEFLFKEADGVILTVNNSVAGEKLRLRYKSNIPLLEFPTYVCDEFFQEEEKYSQNDRKTYVVYGGIIAPSHKQKEIFGLIQFIDLAKRLIKQGLCFHIYSSPYFSANKAKKIYSDYIKLAFEIPNFAFKEGIPADRAIKEFSKYDFASMINVFDGVDEAKIDTFHLDTHMPSKFFTYLSAGLPIIISKENSYVSSLVREYEIGIVISQNEIDSLSEIIKRYDCEKLRTNIKRAREDFSMKNHIGRLIQFYEQAVATKVQSHELTANIV